MHLVSLNSHVLAAYKYRRPTRGATRPPGATASKKHLQQQPLSSATTSAATAPAPAPEGSTRAHGREEGEAPIRGVGCFAGDVSGTQSTRQKSGTSREAYVTLVTTSKYLIGAEVLAKSLRAFCATRPLVALVDTSLPVCIHACVSHKYATNLRISVHFHAT